MFKCYTSVFTSLLDRVRRFLRDEGVGRLEILCGTGEDGDHEGAERVLTAVDVVEDDAVTLQGDAVLELGVGELHDLVLTVNGKDHRLEGVVLGLY